MHRPILSIRFLVGAALLATATVAAASTLHAQARPIFPTAPAPVPGAKAPGIIDGFVSDSGLVPIHGAFVSVLGTQIRIATGPNGRFRITKVPAGQYLVIVKHVGHRPISAVVDVPSGDTLRLSYSMEPAATELNAVVVSETAPAMRMQEFEARRRSGVGEFMTQVEIEARNTVFSTELFRKFLAINVSPSRTTANTEYYALSAREGGNPTVGACPMQVYLDQVPLPTPFNLDLLPSPKDLAGIEVYSGAATIPAQFNGPNRGCGVVLVWTRIGL